MRRSDRELKSHEDIMQVFKDSDVCRLAFNDDKEGVPYILPLNFGYSEDEEGNVYLYFHGATEGYKYDVIARDPRASFEMDCSHQLHSDEEKGFCTMAYRSVIGRGRIEFVEDRQEKLQILSIITDKYHIKHFAFNPEAADRTRVMKLKVEKMSGKSRRKPKQD